MIKKPYISTVYTEIDKENRQYTDKENRIINVKTYIEPEVIDFEGRTVSFKANSNAYKLRPEDMIDLGMLLIKQGQKAAEYNLNHQNVLKKKEKFRRFILDNRVKYVVITHLREEGNLNSPELTKQGVRYDVYNISCVWYEGKEPQNILDRDFSYDDVLMFPNSELEFKHMLEFYGGYEKVLFKGGYIPSPKVPVMTEYNTIRK